MSSLDRVGGCGLTSLLDTCEGAWPWRPGSHPIISLTLHVGGFVAPVVQVLWLALCRQNLAHALQRDLHGPQGADQGTFGDSFS